jgi:hypothetical protein
MRGTDVGGVCVGREWQGGDLGKVEKGWEKSGKGDGSQ